MTERPRLIVRADGSNAVGAGHLMRCLALTHAWRARGGAVTFVSYCESDALAQRLAAASDELLRLPAPHPSDADRARLLEVADRHPGATVALDGYGFDRCAPRDTGCWSSMITPTSPTTTPTGS
jgi:UDP-2,4-diacetamido-2,4,6-trideoxy-beta-L-altropyranose hydrolase